VAATRNVFGYGYTELADCVATQTNANRPALEAIVYGSIAAANANSGSWDTTGVASVRNAADVSIAAGINLLFDSPTQTSLGAIYVQSAVGRHVADALTAAGIAIQAATLPTLLGLALAVIRGANATTVVPGMVATLMAAPDNMVSSCDNSSSPAFNLRWCIARTLARRRQRPPL